MRSLMAESSLEKIMGSNPASQNCMSDAGQKALNSSSYSVFLIKISTIRLQYSSLNN